MMNHLYLNWWTQHHQLRPLLSQAHHSLYILRAWQEDSSIALLIDKLDNISDAVSRVEAQLCWLQTVEEKVAALKSKISKKCIPRPQSSEYQPLLPSLHPSIPPTPLPALQEMSTPGQCFGRALTTWICKWWPHLLFKTSLLELISLAPPVWCYAIPNEVLTLALQSCHSGRNLAAWLAVKIYKLRERTSSNCCGKQGKTMLDQENNKIFLLQIVSGYWHACLDCLLG